jgi:pseudouridylate synthase / pseudouridine kinase
MILAHMAGIKVFATGGLGGVHRGAESSMDISADLTELGRTPVAVIGSGCKGFLDLPRTLEYLETEGVSVGTFADGREGSVDFPSFWSRDSGVKSPAAIKDEKQAAAMIRKSYQSAIQYPVLTCEDAHHTLGLTSGLFMGNPIPAEFSIPVAEMQAVIEEAIRSADAAGATGNDNTPFILSKIKELTGQKSITANRALIEANVKRGTLVAKELLELEKSDILTQG